MVTTLLGVLVALLVMVTLLLMGPTRLLSYFTVMVLLAPGLIGAVLTLGHGASAAALALGNDQRLSITGVGHGELAGRRCRLA
jgi:hypothetical protein